MLTRSLALSCVLAMGLASALAQVAKPLHIKNAKIEAGRGRIIESGDILIVGGKIEAVGTVANPPADAETIDASGLVVYPGFFDGYSTRGLKLPDWATSLARDSRTVAPPTMDADNKKGFRPELRASDCLDLGSTVASWHAVGVTQACLAPSSGAFRGQSTLVSIAPNGKEFLVNSFAQVVAFSTGTGAGYPDSLMGMISYIRQSFADATRLSQTTAPDEKSPWLPLVSVVKGTTPLMFVADSERDISRALILCSEFGCAPIVTMARDAYLKTEMLQRSKAKLIVSVNIGNEPSKTPAQGADATPAPVLEERWANWKKRSENLLAIAKSNIPFAFSSEGDLDGFLTNVRRIIKLGLDRTAALDALTIGAAKLFGVESSLGTVEPGKTANLVLMSGDFADEKSVAKFVIVGGTKFSLEKSGGSQ